MFLKDLAKYPVKKGIQIVFFLFLHKNICYGYRLEVPQLGTSNEYPKMCFSAEIRKFQYFLLEKKNALYGAVS